MTTPFRFGPDFLTKLEYLSLVSRRVFHGTLLAQRRTARSGAGVEFAEHRPYTASEDFRYLDWNIYARHGTLLVKRFQEEQDLHVYVLLDSSRSMGLGGPPKFDFARRVAAAMAYIALADLDSVAVTAFAGTLAADFPLTRGKGVVLNLLRFLERLRPDGGATDLAASLTAFVRRAPRRGLAIVVSDWLDPAGFQPGLDVLRHAGFEVQVVRVFDPGEADPRVRGDLELVNVETDARRRVTVTEKSLRRYRELFEEYGRALNAYCRQYGVGCSQSSTAVPFEQFVLQMMRSAGAVG